MTTPRTVRLDDDTFNAWQLVAALEGKTTRQWLEEQIVREAKYRRVWPPPSMDKTKSGRGPDKDVAAALERLRKLKEDS